MLTSFTEATFFLRCAGDWDQVAPSESHDLSGRVYYGTLINLDEAYRFLKMVGLIPAQNTKGGQRANGGDAGGMPADAASEFNKLMQTGSLGADAVATSCRLLFASGRPVEPHSPPPVQLEAPQGFKRWQWPKLLECMVSPLGLPSEATNHALARGAFRLAPAHETQAGPPSGSVPAQEDHVAFEPGPRGYSLRLVDGTITRLRFRNRGGVFEPELRATNRDIPVTQGVDVKSMANRVLEHFKVSHTVVPWSEEARLTFKGFQMVFDAQCALMRDQGNETRAALLGSSPWMLGMISVALLILEIAVGEAPMGGEAKVMEHHVVRAWDILEVSGAAGAVRVGAVGDEWGQWALTQAQPRRALPGSDVGGGSAGGGVDGEGDREFERLGDQASHGGASAAEEEGPPLASVANDGAGDAARAPAAAAAAEGGGADADAHFLMPGDPEDGASVQMQEHGDVFLTDREIMKRTILRGEPIVFCSDVRGSIRKTLPSQEPGVRGRTVALRQHHWKAVTQAGLSQYHIGTYDDGSSAEDQPGAPRIHLKLPPTDRRDLHLPFHNRLMKLCGVSLQAYTSAIGAKETRKRRAPPASASAPRAARQRGAAVPGGQAGAPRGPGATAAAGGVARGIAGGAGGADAAATASGAAPTPAGAAGRGAAPARARPSRAPGEW
ncbi:unnamed protein product [Prorocentrum cordatum]|uniref:Uncharacterized protein n=1 Tax=Prorocentrum cordatum TaxID=2364126 RepID=A0ABN9XX52_9DINO|nr:unnamed protein product [Polarella glacialis]